MKATDLMIGDWVDVYHELPDESGFYKPLQVTGLHQNDGVCFGHGVIESPWDDPEEFEAVKPIPLTPEILEKNGFVKVPHEYEYPDCQCWTNNVDGIYSFEIVTDEHRRPYILGNGDMGDYEWVNFECKYVHELQHALKLCRIEKEIVL